MTTDVQIADLTASVKARIETQGKMGADDFDALLLAHGLIARIPSVTAPERGSFTRLRDTLRRKVAQELKRRGLALVAEHRGEYVIKDAMVAGMVRMTEIPAQQASMIKQRLMFSAKTAENQLSELAKLLPPELGKRLREEAVYLSQRHAHDVQRALWQMSGSVRVDWPAELRAVLPQEPPPFLMQPPSKQRKRRKRTA